MSILLGHIVARLAEVIFDLSCFWIHVCLRVRYIPTFELYVTQLHNSRTKISALLTRIRLNVFFVKFNTRQKDGSTLYKVGLLKIALDRTQCMRRCLYVPVILNPGCAR